VPPIVKTVATTDEGVEQLVQGLDAHRTWLAGESGAARRAERTRQMLLAWLRDETMHALIAELPDALAAAADAVASGTSDPGAAVDALLARFRSG
jgi:LAO/AO transport system kinase